MSFSQIPWFLLCGGLTVLGLIGSWVVYRRRGARAAMRGAAWALLPIALYLIGIIQPIWNFAYGLVFSPKVWSGLIVMAVALLLFTVTGGLRGRSGRKQEGEKKRKKQDTATGPGELVASSGTTASRAQPAPAPAKRKSSAADDDDFGEVADILKRHGIS
jgi:hypothetical protein